MNFEWEDVPVPNNIAPGTSSHILAFIESDFLPFLCQKSGLRMNILELLGKEPCQLIIIFDEIEIKNFYGIFA